MIKMKKKTLIVLLSVAAVLLVCAGLLLFGGLLRGAAPDIRAGAHTVAAGSWPDIIYQGAKGSVLQVTDADGAVLWEQEAPSESGEAQPADSGLSVGEYQLRLADRKGKIRASDQFTVTDAALFTEESVNILGEMTMLRYDASLLGEDGWIGVYERGAVPGRDDSFIFLNASERVMPDGVLSVQEMRGKWVLFNSYAGDYTVYLFPDSDYDAVASWDFSTAAPDGFIMRWLTSTGKAGRAGGIVSVVGPVGEPSQDAVLYWGRGGEPLADYLPVKELVISQNTVRRVLTDDLVIPEGATELLLYNAKNGKPTKLLCSMRIPDELRAVEEEPLYSFVVLSDTHVTRYSWKRNNQQTAKAFADIGKNMPEALFVLDNGDVTDNGNEQEYHLLQELSKKSGVPLYLTMGNHDAGKNGGDFTGYLSRFLQSAGRDQVYTRLDEEAGTFLLLGTQGPLPGLNLDASAAVLHEDQLSWIEEQVKDAVKEHPDRPVFLFLHQPLAYTVADTAHGSDVYPSSEVHDLLDKIPQVFYFSGHTHRSLDGSWPTFKVENGAQMIHNGCVCELNTDEGTIMGSEGILVEVYKDHIELRGRDFLSEKWMGTAYRRMDFDF